MWLLVISSIERRPNPDNAGQRKRQRQWPRQWPLWWPQGRGDAAPAAPEARLLPAETHQQAVRRHHGGPGGAPAPGDGAARHPVDTIRCDQLSGQAHVPQLLGQSRLIRGQAWVVNVLQKSPWPLHYKQALRNSCELLRQRKELHTSSWNCMQAHGTSCKLIELHKSSGNWMQTLKLNISSWNCMQAQGTACKLMDLHASCKHSGTFWNILHAFWNILKHSACILEHSGTFWML